MVHIRFPACISINEQGATSATPCNISIDSCNCLHDFIDGCDALVDEFIGMLEHRDIAGFLCEAFELLLVAAGGDAVPELIVHDEHLEVTDSSAVAGVKAHIAASAMIEDPARTCA